MGYEYQGNTIPAPRGKFLFGDILMGRLFYTNIAEMRQGNLADIKEWKITLNHRLITLREACGSNWVDLHFGCDMRDEMYILTKANGKLYKEEG
jgi:hypothetical protein